MTSIIENQAYDDDAYKLMALFYDPKKSNDENLKTLPRNLPIL